MDTHKAEPDILIAGAGPTGLALAAEPRNHTTRPSGPRRKSLRVV